MNRTFEQCDGRKAKLLILAVTSNETIKLNNVYCVDKLQIRSNPELTKDDLTRWPHLQGSELQATKLKKSNFLLVLTIRKCFGFLTNAIEKRRSVCC